MRKRAIFDLSNVKVSKEIGRYLTVYFRRRMFRFDFDGPFVLCCQYRETLGPYGYTAPVYRLIVATPHRLLEAADMMLFRRDSAYTLGQWAEKRRLDAKEKDAAFWAAIRAKDEERAMTGNFWNR